MQTGLLFLNYITSKQQKKDLRLLIFGHLPATPNEGTGFSAAFWAHESKLIWKRKWFNMMNANSLKHRPEVLSGTSGKD